MAKISDKIPQTVTPDHVTALHLRASGIQVKDIAKRFGVSRRQVSRWLESARQHVTQDEGFLKHAEHRMARLIPKAMSAIEDSLSKESDPRVRLQAANMVLGTYGILRERKELTIKDATDEQLISTVRELVSRGPAQIADGIIGIEETEQAGEAPVSDSDETTEQ